MISFFNHFQPSEAASPVRKDKRLRSIDLCATAQKIGFSKSPTLLSPTAIKSGAPFALSASLSRALHLKIVAAIWAPGRWVLSIERID